jgi:hypothetical protein
MGFLMLNGSNYKKFLFLIKNKIKNKKNVALDN